MKKSLRRFLVASMCLSGFLLPIVSFADQVIAACQIKTEDTEAESAPGNNPAAGQTVVCVDSLDNEGVNGSTAGQVTVEIQSPSGGISTTGQPGIILGEGATITVAGPARPVSTSGNSAVGIEVLSGATITIQGVVSTSGNNSPAIAAGENAEITVDSGTVRSGGGESPGISVGANATVNLTGNARITTGNSNSDAIVLSGESGELTVGTDAVVTTSSGMSNPVQIDGMGSSVTVSGEVRSSSGNATAILGTAEDIVITVKEGGLITAQSSNSNAIEITSTGAVITVENGGEVKISSGNSAAIVAGDSGTVNLDGVVSASSSASQGVVLGDSSELTVRSRGVIETSSSESQAVLIEEMAETATINVNRGGNIDAVGAQAIVDRGMTDTTVVVDGTVFGGSSDPVIDLGAGDDTLTVNGTVHGTSANPVVSLGEGDDTLNDNSSQTIEGPGVLVSAGGGMDTLNISNGKSNSSEQYGGFETTNVGRNTNPNDPANGMETNFDVTDDQSGNEINAGEGGAVNVKEGGTADVRPDTSERGGSGQQGGNTTFESGSTANAATENRVGSQTSQEFSNTQFESGTRVATSSGFIRGTATNNAETGRGEIAVESDFANEARVNNLAMLGSALNERAITPASVEEEGALNRLIEQAPTAAEAEALLSNISGEIGAQTAASGVQAAALFNSALLPSNSRDAGRSLAANQDGDGNVWFSGLGGFVDTDENSDSTAFDSNTYGVVVGYDYALNSGSLEAATVGVGVGYSNTDVNGRGDSAGVDAYSLGAYFEGANGPMTGNVAAAYSYQNLGNGDFSTSSGNLFTVSSEGFYNLSKSDRFIVGPIGRIGATFGGYGSFSSEEGDFNIDYDSDSISQITTGLGVRVGGLAETGAGPLSLNLDLLYAGALGERSAQFDGELANSAVSVAAPFANSNGLFIGVEAGLSVSKSTTVGVRYNGEIGGDIQSHSGEIRVSVGF